MIEIPFLETMALRRKKQQRYDVSQKLSKANLQLASRFISYADMHVVISSHLFLKQTLGFMSQNAAKTSIMIPRSMDKIIIQTQIISDMNIICSKFFPKRPYSNSKLILEFEKNLSAP